MSPARAELLLLALVLTAQHPHLAAHAHALPEVQSSTPQRESEAALGRSGDARERAFAVAATALGTAQELQPKGDTPQAQKDESTSDQQKQDALPIREEVAAEPQFKFRGDDWHPRSYGPTNCSAPLPQLNLSGNIFDCPVLYNVCLDQGVIIYQVRTASYLCERILRAFCNTDTCTACAICVSSHAARNVACSSHLGLGRRTGGTIPGRRGSGWRPSTSPTFCGTRPACWASGISGA
jgi:hypothetical protein